MAWVSQLQAVPLMQIVVDRKLIVVIKCTGEENRPLLGDRSLIKSIWSGDACGHRAGTLLGRYVGKGAPPLSRTGQCFHTDLCRFGACFVARDHQKRSAPGRSRHGQRLENAVRKEKLNIELTGNSALCAQADEATSLLEQLVQSVRCFLRRATVLVSA
jgi:hypothetical protein